MDRTGIKFTTDTLDQQCTQLLYDNILSMLPGYEPGSRINVKVIAQELGISETPLKTAVKQLESRGILCIMPRKGTYIAKLSKRDIEELITVREGLEELAIRIGNGYFDQEILMAMASCLKQCERALREDDAELYRDNDRQFHFLIVQASHNNRLEKLYLDFCTSEQIINVYRTRSKESRKVSTSEHWLLLEGFRSGDTDRILLSTEGALAKYQAAVF